MGIRISLGTDPTSVARMLLRPGLAMVLVGQVIGISLAAVASRLVSGFLHGVGALDPVAFTVAPVLLASVAFLAAWIPTQRVSRIDPVRALRSN